MDSVVAIFQKLPTELRPLVGALFTCMLAIAGLMIMTSGRSSTQVAGGLLTIRNAIFGGLIFVLAGVALVSFLGRLGITF